MEYELLKTAAKNIRMSNEQKKCIAENCKARIEEEMEARPVKQKKGGYLRKPAAALIGCVICLSLSVTALAAKGSLKGYFRDIKNPWGAVVGTAYEQATDEIAVSAEVQGKKLVVRAAFVEPQMMPFRVWKNLGIAAYQITDGNGTVVQEGKTEELAKVAGGTAAIPISLDGLRTGSYKLIITAFVTAEKAEQPMQISGYWECAFVK